MAIYPGKMVSEQTFKDCRQEKILPNCGVSRRNGYGNGTFKKKLNLTGQQYGRLTVLAPAENIGSRTAWLCQCQCGKRTVVKTYHLRSGHVTSCGCNDNITARLNYVDGTCVEMLKAKTVRRNNTSGVPGVDWRSSKGSWRASICFKGKRYYLGNYKRFEDVVQARKYAEEHLHDEFLREFAKKGGSGNAE